MIDLLQTAPEASSFSPLIMIGLMILVMWLFMWRPESKRRKEMSKFREALKNGDKIITAGGIYGTVKEVKETTLKIEISPNVVIKIDKALVVADANAPEKTE